MMQINEQTAQTIETNLLGTHFTITNEEMKAAQERGNRVDGRWAEPYIRMTGRLKNGVPRRAYGEGQNSDFTSFASCHPARAAYTMHVTLDVNAMKLVELSRRGHSFGHGFCENGMSLRGLGMFLCLMLPTPDKKWRLIGHILLDSRNGGTPMIFIEHPERLPTPNEKGRVYLVARNYEMIERARLSTTVERNGRIETVSGTGVMMDDITPTVRFQQTRTAPVAAQGTARPSTVRPSGFGQSFGGRSGGLNLDLGDDTFGGRGGMNNERHSGDDRRATHRQERHRAPWEREAPQAPRAQSTGQRTPAARTAPQRITGRINLNDLKL